MAARTRGFTTRRNLVWGGTFAFMGVVHLALFLAVVFIGSGSGSIPPIFWPVMSVCYLGLASLYLIPGVASCRRERSRRNAASRP